MPWSLGPDYGRTSQWCLAQAWFYAIWLVPLAAVGLLALLPGRRVWLTAFAVLLVCLSPNLGLVSFDFQRISTVADRYAYLAMLGPALALCWLLGGIHAGSAVVRGCLWLGAGFALCVLGAMSFQQTSYWRDTDTLFQHARRLNPQSAVAAFHLGLLQDRQGHHREAVALYRAGLAAHAEFPELCDALASALAAEGKTSEAVAELLDAAARFPQAPYLQVRLGTILAARGENRKAIEHYRLALAASPDDVKARRNLAAALEASGQTAAAKREYETVLAGCPEAADVHYNLGNLAMRQPGGLAEAVDHYRAALRIKPDYAPAHANLGLALLEQEQIEAAIAEERAALAIDPRLVPAHVQLGSALAAAGRKAEAAVEFRRALDLLPADSEPARQVRGLLQKCTQK
jgi:tetratricopeptide (TPR) repeat protein